MDVRTKDFDWKALCQEVEGDRLKEKDTAYEFSNGRIFKAPAIPYQSEIPTE